ncbi:hypothetical protein NT6N_02990 [Oceaniferula spumae]|uniref:DUF4174 domain-containing protein n=1 Tax=Oceaniferula spumae TaxID=2979115 RepID=A0AAT9FH16_9BACT
MKLICKRLLLVILILAIGGSAGFWLRSMYHRYPLTAESQVMHYCSCIEDNPKYQTLVLNAAEEVNESINDRTHEFIDKHELYHMDFDAVFIPIGNGNYRIKTWCSNRTDQVYNLYEEYTDLVDECLTPHKNAMDQAHADHGE